MKGKRWREQQHPVHCLVCALILGRYSTSVLTASGHFFAVNRLQLPMIICFLHYLQAGLDDCKSVA